MSDLRALTATLARVAALVARHGGKGLTEQDTKHALIAPVLEALGWSLIPIILVGVAIWLLVRSGASSRAAGGFEGWKAGA